MRHSYWSRWGTPGGLSKRRESPERTAVRETAEEVNLEVELMSEPAVVVEPVPRRVDIVFWPDPRPAPRSTRCGRTRPEITKVGWFQPADLPDLQPETATALVALARTGAIDLGEAGITPSSGHPTR